MALSTPPNFIPLYFSSRFYVDDVLVNRKILVYSRQRRKKLSGQGGELNPGRPNLSYCVGESKFKTKTMKELIETTISNLKQVIKALKEFERSQKKDYVLRRREMGDTFEEIGKDLDLSRQAVEQFIKYKAKKL